MRLFHRRVLVGLFAGAVVLAFPAIASADFSATLTLTGATAAGATNQTVNYHLHFTSTTGDSPAKIVNQFPSGMLADSTINSDQCLTGTHLTAACQIGTGTATLNPGGTLPAAEYLVPPPNPAQDVAGVQLVLQTGVSTFQNAGPPADVTVRPNDAGLNVTFSNIPGPTNGPAPQLQDINLQLTDQRLPSSCAAETMTVNVTSEQSGSTAPTAPYQSTGCPAQPYAPKVAAQVNGFANGGAEVIAGITQNANEAASKTIELELPSSLQPNLLADAGCLTGSPCQVGTASAQTPLAPPIALANGTITLGGSITTPTITVAFPAPYALTFTGVVNTSNNTVTVNNVPDVPITSLSLDVTHSQFGEAFTTTCAPGSIGAVFNGQGGQSETINTPIKYGGSCVATAPGPGKPTSSATLSGLSSGHPKLKLNVKHGSNAPNISSVSIKVGSGLSFSSKALIKKCTGHGSHRKCKTKSAKGLSVSGAKIKSVKIAGGKLVITFTHAVSSVTITARGPLLTESKALQKRVKKHKVKHLTVVVKVTDAKGTKTTITLHPKA